VSTRRLIRQPETTTRPPGSEGNGAATPVLSDNLAIDSTATARIGSVAGPGSLTKRAFDVGVAHTWRVQVSEAGVGAVIDEEGGPDNSFGPFSNQVTAETTYLVTVSNPGEGDAAPVFVHGTIAWH